MRSPGLCLALVATAQLVVFSSLSAFPTRAFAQDPPATTTTAAPAPSDGTVMVHINSSSVVRLEHRAGETGAWTAACTSPCDTRVPVGEQYQIVGDNLNPSKPFMLDSTKGDKIQLDVAPGDKKKASVGTIFLVGGAVLAVTGIIVMIASSGSGFVSGGGSTNETTHIGHTNGIFIGGALLFAGLATGFYGVGTMVNNGKTHVGGDTQAAQAGRVASDSVLKTALAPTNKPAFMIPVLSGRF